jgi:hypothetical protein
MRRCQKEPAVTRPLPVVANAMERRFDSGDGGRQWSISHCWEYPKLELIMIMNHDEASSAWLLTPKDRFESFRRRCRVG